MSFFRNGGDSSSSGSSDDVSDNAQSVSRPVNGDVGRDAGRHVGLPNGQADARRDVLTHALLEHFYVNQVLDEQESRQITPYVKREAARRHQVASSRLAPYVDSTFGADIHSSTRRDVRRMLDRLEIHESNTQQVALPRTAGADLRAASGRLLTYGEDLGPTSELTNRYSEEFEEIGLLGKGGFGQVFHVKHRLDNQFYAVKKIPIRPAMAQKIKAEGKPAMDEMLKEVRSLSRLQHPNVVRYFNSWIGNSTDVALATSSKDQYRTYDNTSDPSLSSSQRSMSLHRIRTQSDSTETVGTTFESPSEQSLKAPMPVAVGNTSTLSTEPQTDGDGAVAIYGPTPALHVQMEMFPMTLADFIAPKQPDTTIEQLSHCFHVETSIGILLAILDGVEYLHATNMIHRDLKPANIFIKHVERPHHASNSVDLSSCSDCRAARRAQPANLSVCIGDFGLVTEIAQDSDALAPSASAVGTAVYRPAAHKSYVSPRLDIFAVGVIACELLHRFGTETERRITLHKLKDGELPDPFAPCARKQAGQVRDCVRAMLSGDSPDDVPSIADLKRRLSAVLDTRSLEEGGEVVLRRLST